MDAIDKKFELYHELEQKKNKIKEATFEAKSKKMALELLPDSSAEYEKEKTQMFIAKRNLLETIREYEKKKEELQNHCSKNNLLPYYDLETGLYWLEFFCMN